MTDTAVETEGDISKEDFERLKAKYRKEALKLASESERAGYEKGRAETIKATEAQLSAWKTVLSSFESFEGDVVKSGKPDLLVQHVIEQIYKRMKQRFSQRPSDCTLPQVKDVLLNSADDLLRSLPPIALISSSKSAKKIFRDEYGENLCASAANNQRGVDAFRRVLRPVMFRVIHQPMAPRYFIRVNIPDAAEHIVKGVFVDGEYKVYRVESEICRINYAAIDANRRGHEKERHFVLSYSFERRHRDFRTLHSQLQKEYGRLIIPELPNRPYKARTSRDNTAENRVRFRKRQFSLWLQYLSNIERLQLSSTLINFLTGLPKLGGAELSTSTLNGSSNTTSSFKSSLSGTAEVATNSAKRNRLFPSSVNNSSAAAPSLPLPVMEEGSLQSKLDGISECFIYARGSQSLTNQLCASPFSQEPLLYDATKKEMRTICEADKDDSALRIFEHRQLALRDLITAERHLMCCALVSRDILQLEPVAQTATETAHDLASGYSEVGSAYNIFVDSMESWRSTENENTIEHRALSAMIDAAVACRIPMEQIADTIHQECCECMEFLTANCVKAARETVTKVTKSYPPQSFNSEVLLSSHSALSSANEGVAAAVTVAQSWECCRRLRSSMILQQLLLSARTVAAQHTTMKKVWLKAAQNMQILSRDSIELNSRLHAGLEAQDASLKHAIFDELQEYEENIQAIKETNEKASQMQDMYVKISGGMSSLRSFRAIFSRPKLPGGVRRDPRPKPAVLDSNREGIASWGESPLTCNRPHIHRTSKTEKDAVGDGIPKATASRGTGAANYGTNHCEDKLDDARSSVPPSSTETASGGFDEFQDQRQRQNARKNASGATSRGAHKIKSQTAPSIIPHNVFGAVPQPASALPTPTVTEAQSNSDQDIAALRFATSNNTQHDQRSRTRAASAELNSNTQSNPSVRANPSTPQLGKEHSAKPTVDLPDVRSEKEKLPAGWQQVVSEDGSVYYYHTLTRVSRWDKPTEKVAAALDARLKKSQAEVGEAVQRRKEEFESEKKLQEERDLVAQKLKSKIADTIRKWRHPPEDRLPRDLGELLRTVHSVVSFIPADAITKNHELNVNSHPAELRKAYLKAVRLVHPDKLPDGLQLEEKLLAEAVFISLNDSFNTYTTRLEASKRVESGDNR